MMNFKEKGIFILCILVFILLSVSCPLFFIGYVPKIKYKQRNYSELKGDVLEEQFQSTKILDKVVLIVIDSLRPGMINNYPMLWYNYERFLNYSWAYPTTAMIQAPSLSYARTKSLITGTVSGFLDALSNTNNGEIKQDNLLDSLNKFRNFSINFYGDNSWTRLFPGRFKESMPLDPFYIKDYYNSDRKITVKLRELLNNSLDNWDMLVCHYLGVDHVGHLEGPYGKNIGGKFMEFDVILKLVVEQVLEKSNKSMVILTSDHGMSELGGHGGASYEELTTPMIFFHKGFRFTGKPDPAFMNITQNDLVPALSLLLGVPIPLDSVGVIPWHLLALLPTHKSRQTALTMNFEQMIKLLNQKTRKLYRQQFYNISKTAELNYHQQLELYKLLKQMQTACIVNYIRHSYSYMDLALNIVIFCYISSLVLSFHFQISTKQFSLSNGIFYFSIISIILTIVFYQPFYLCFFRSAKLAICIFLLIVTSYSVGLIKEHIMVLWTTLLNSQSTGIFLSHCFIVIVVSKLYHQFIQEQHRVYYYVVSTTFTLLVIRDFYCKYKKYLSINQNIERDNNKLLSKTSTTVYIPEKDINNNEEIDVDLPHSMLLPSDLNSEYSINTDDRTDFNNTINYDTASADSTTSTTTTTVNYNSHLQNVIKPYLSKYCFAYYIKSVFVCAILYLILDRFCRIVNTTGELWTTEMDFGKYINGWNNRFNLLAMMIVLLLIVSAIMWTRNTLSKALIIQTYLVITILFRIFDFMGYQTVANCLVWIHYGGVIIQIIVSLISRIVCKNCFPTIPFSTGMLLINLLSCRTQNVFLWTAVLIKTILIKRIWKKKLSKLSLYYQYLFFKFLGMETFFQLGNSNSLTTIDVLPGFVGLNYYNPTIVQPMVAITVISGHIYWLIVWIEWLYRWHSIETQKLQKETTLSSSVAPSSSSSSPSLSSSLSSSSSSSSSSAAAAAAAAISNNLFQQLILAFVLVCSLENLFLFISCWLYQNQLIAWYVMAPSLIYTFFHNDVILLITLIFARIRFWW